MLKDYKLVEEKVKVKMRVTRKKTLKNSLVAHKAIRPAGQPAKRENLEGSLELG